MARRVGESIEVRVAGDPDDAPMSFLWRGRLYVVRAVLGHWRERVSGGRRQPLGLCTATKVRPRQGAWPHWTTNVTYGGSKPAPVGCSETVSTTCAVSRVAIRRLRPRAGVWSRSRTERMSEPSERG